MKVLLSIKPEFADKIFEGTKNYEYRKVIFKNRNIEKVIVYSSYPVKLVIGEFFIEDIMEKKPSELWQETKDDSGISEDYFKKYFNKKSLGYAIKISSRQLYQKPKNLAELYNNPPPQSFAYIE
jgi:predicted transcriptional regulator